MCVCVCVSLVMHRVCRGLCVCVCVCVMIFEMKKRLSGHLNPDGFGLCPQPEKLSISSLSKRPSITNRTPLFWISSILFLMVISLRADQDLKSPSSCIWGGGEEAESSSSSK